MQHTELENLELKTILLVDDDPFMLSIIGKTLSNLGFANVVTAENGQQALTTLQTKDIDLLLTDIQMPVMNGLELIQQVRCGKSEAPRSLPIIIFTAFSTDETLGSALALEVNGFIAKPVKPLTISQKIIQALSESELSLRTIEDYASIQTNLSSLLSQQDSDSPRHEKPAETEANTEEILLEIEESVEPAQTTNLLDLLPNMRLTQDVKHQNGSMLLSAGFVLQKNTINRLRELRMVLASQEFHVEQLN
jgi:CheY-like chemotaxis protein